MTSSLYDIFGLENDAMIKERQKQFSHLLSQPAVASFYTNTFCI